MRIYCTAKVEIPEYFRAESSQLMLVIWSSIEQDIHNMGGKCDVVKYPLYFTIYRLMCDTLHSSSNTEHVFYRLFLTTECTLMPRGGGGSLSCEKY